MINTKTSLLGAAAVVLAIGAVSACSVEERSYATGGGGDGSGSGGGGGASSSGSGGDATAGSGGAGGDMPLTAEAACAKYSAAVCAQFDKCFQFLETVGYGDNATCQERYQIICMATLGAPETAWTIDGMAACAAAQSAGSCLDFIQSFSGVGTGECQPPPGPRPTGAACFEGAQCDSAYCRKTGGHCGTCAFKEGEGGVCAENLDCKEGLACVSGVCGPSAGLGEMCVSGQIPCRPGLLCYPDSICALPLALGEKCSTDPSRCDLFNGLYCDAQTLLCKARLFSGVDQPCGDQGSEKYVCPAGGICNQKTPPLCIPHAKDGESCAPGMGGPGCMPPSICLNTICTPPDPAQCG